MTPAAKRLEEETGICSTHNIRMYHPQCSRCHGEGEVEDDDGIVTFRPHLVPCWECRGCGESSWFECELCVENMQDEHDEYWRKQDPTP